MADNAEVISTKVKGYRAGETLPLEFSRDRILTMASGLTQAKAAGMPERGITDYTKKILLEGRDDAGAGEFNRNNPKALKLYDDTIAAGASSTSATYAAAILDKTEVAARLNIPFELAWNGTGKTRNGEGDGQRHAARAEKFNNVEQDPRNADLVDTIKRGLSGDISPQERLLMLSNRDLTKSVFGDVIGYRDGEEVYTKAALSTAESLINSRLDQLRPEDKKSVEKELGGYYKDGQLLNDFSAYYKEAAGVGTPVTDALKSRTSMGYKVVPKSAGYTAIMDSIIGKDPDMSAYKAATSQRYPPTAPPESGLSSILSAVKSLFN